MAPVTMEELKTLRAALVALEDRKDQTCAMRKDSVEAAIAYDIAHQQWWAASSNYTRKLNEFIESGQVEGVRP